MNNRIRALLIASFANLTLLILVICFMKPLITIFGLGALIPMFLLGVTGIAIGTILDDMKNEGRKDRRHRPSKLKT